MLLAVLGMSLGRTMRGLSGIENVLAGTANLVSAAVFIAIADIDLIIVLIVAVGATLGGGIGNRAGHGRA